MGETFKIIIKPSYTLSTNNLKNFYDYLSGCYGRLKLDYNDEDGYYTFETNKSGKIEMSPTHYSNNFVKLTDHFRKGHNTLYYCQEFKKCYFNEYLLEVIKKHFKIIDKFITTNNLEYIEYGFSRQIAFSYVQSAEYIEDHRFNVQNDYNLIDIITIMTILMMINNENLDEKFYITSNFIEKYNKIKDDVAIYNILDKMETYNKIYSEIDIPPNKINNNQDSNIMKQLNEIRFCNIFNEALYGSSILKN